MAQLGRVAGPTIVVSDRARRTMVQALIVVVLGAGLWEFLVATAARHGYFDLRVYYGAINFWIRDGGQIYDYLLPKTEYGFTYPPFAAVLMAPMAYLSWHGAIAMSLVLNLVATVLVVYWLVGPIVTRLGWSRWFSLAIALELALVFEPVRETVNFGQVNVILLALVAADVLFGVRRGHRLAGVGIGLATAVKLTPGVFIIYLLVTRRWRAAGVASATAAAATWLAATIAPDASRVFWTDAIWNTDRVGSTAFVSNQSLNGFVSRLNPVAPSTALWGVLALAAFAIWMMRTRRAVHLGDERAALALTGVFGCLVSPITWVHHLVWVLPALVLLADGAFARGRSLRSRRVLLVVSLLAYALMCSRAVWAFEYQYQGWGLLGSNLYVFALCGLLVGMPLRASSPGDPAVAGRGGPTAEDVPDLVDLDRRVTAAFDAKDAGLPLPAGSDAERPLVDA